MNNQLIKAFDLWIELTGINPNSTTWSMKNWSIQKANDQIKESIELDESLVTTILLLRYFSKQFLSDRTFSVNEILSNYDTFQAYIQKSKELMDILHSNEVEELVNDLINNTKSALLHYGVHRHDVLDALNDPEMLTFLRRDSLKSLKTLDVHQFSQSHASSNSTPKYFKNVFQFWNINSLIKSMSTSIDSGVSLCLIKDSASTQSYFVFAIRNGGTVSILTDKPKSSHPLQSKMARRPERDFSERISKHHFPYNLMDLRFDHRGNVFVQEEINSLVAYQAEANPLKPINELEPDEVIWIIMMFELIQNKFWTEDFKTKELSYTAEMISTYAPSNELVRNLSLANHNKIHAPLLKNSDVTTAKLVNDWDHEPPTYNDWMEERYKDQINEDIINLLENPTNTKAYISTNSSGDTSVAHLSKSDLQNLHYKEKDALIALKPMDTTDFGTQDELLKNQRWHARYNKAKQIEHLANKEFEEISQAISNWYRQAITNNIPNLLESVAKKEFIALHEGYGLPTDEIIVTEKNILNFVDYQDESWYFGWKTSKIGAAFYQESEQDKRTCYLTGSPIHFRAHFSPTTPKGLAKLCNCEVTELPDVLQHWRCHNQYKGNPNLQRLDPLIWAVENPWIDFPLNVVIYLSKSGYNQLRKKHNLPLDKFWLQTT